MVTTFLASIIALKMLFSGWNTRWYWRPESLWEALEQYLRLLRLCMGILLHGYLGLCSISSTSLLVGEASYV